MEPARTPKPDAASRADPRRKLTGTPLLVANLLHALAKTSRSFGFYSRENRAIQIFLDELFTLFNGALTEHGALRLIVAADAFHFDAVEVYHDADREAGLPFRLFRDGVRAVTFKPGLSRDEIERLLEVLSRRATIGREAEEEDVVTLLWKASMEHVAATVVEGFTHDLHAAGDFSAEGGEGKRADSGEAIPRMMERISGKRETLTERARGRTARSFVDEEATEALAELLPVGSGKRRGARTTPVRDSGATAAMIAVSEDDAPIGLELGGVAFAAGLYPGARDYPLPLMGGMVEIKFEPIIEAELAELRKELDEEAAIGILHLFDYCFELCSQPGAKFSPDDFRGLLTPIRRFLVSTRDLESYDRLLKYLRRVTQGAHYRSPVPETAAAMLAECSTPEALAALSSAAQGDETREIIAWEILNSLLPDLAPGDVLELLGRSMADRMAAILAGVMIRRTGGDLALFDAALQGHEPWRALAALRCLDLVRTPPAVRLVEGATRWPDPAVRRAAIRVLGRVPPAESTGGTLVRSLKDEDEGVRAEALASLHKQAEKGWAPILSRWFGEESGKGPEDWRLAVVEVLVHLDPDHATTFLSQRLAMGLRAKLGGFVGTPEQLAWNRLAAQGLSLAATPTAIERLREVRTQGDEEFRELVNRLLFEARHRAEETTA